MHENCHFVNVVLNGHAKKPYPVKCRLRYSPGDTPTNRVNVLENDETSAYPHEKTMSLIGFVVLASNFLDSAIRVA